MKQSETDALKMLEQAFSDDELETYVFTIQDYFADETDRLEIDSPDMADYLDDIIPEFTEAYDSTKHDQWLCELREVINHAKRLATK
ncbi:hypothetical protein [Lacticaseibacillus sp. N501-2]|uniref:hypothetical protein n=1 Tax=Lacticaseibacillus salsurae TaxID=3367729 RepID=UPI0038B26B7B